MNKKVKKFFKYMFIIYMFGFPLLSILGGNNIIDFEVDSLITNYLTSILGIIEESVFSNLYFEIFAPIFGDNILIYTIFCIIICLIFIDLLFILFDVLMFIPNFIGKMFEKFEKVGAKDE